MLTNAENNPSLTRTEGISRRGYSHFDQSGSGIGDFMRKLASQKLSTKFKSGVNKLGGFPKAFPGEVHPMSITRSKRTGLKTLAYNSYLGPNTNVAGRLRRGDKPLPGPKGQFDSADRAGFAHDLRFATASSDPIVGIAQLEAADEKFMNKLKELEGEGHPRFNTQVGRKIIKVKKNLGRRGLLKRGAFHKPFGEDDPVDLAESELAKLEQQGYGLKPGDILKKEIQKLVSRKPEFKSIAKMLTRKFFPVIIKEISRITKIKPKQLGGRRDTFENALAREMKGSGIGITTLIGAASAAAPIVIPLIAKLARFLVPKILQLFKKGRGQYGTGVMDTLKAAIGTPIFSVIKQFAKLMWKAARASGRERRGSGPGFMDFIKKAVKRFTSMASKVIKGTKRILPKAEKIISKIKEPKDIIKVLLDDALPEVVRLIKKKVGIKPRQMGSGFRSGLSKELSRIIRKKGIRRAQAPISRLIVPLIVSMFGKKGMGKKAQPRFAKLIKKLIAREQQGTGIKEFLKGFGKGFIKVISAFIKTARPIIEKAGPILVEKGLPILLEMIKKRMGPKM